MTGEHWASCIDGNLSLFVSTFNFLWLYPFECDFAFLDEFSSTGGDPPWHPLYLCLFAIPFDPKSRSDTSLETEWIEETIEAKFLRFWPWPFLRKFCWEIVDYGAFFLLAVWWYSQLMKGRFVLLPVTDGSWVIPATRFQHVKSACFFK